MFLFTNDYFSQRVMVPGGLADYMGEFFVQFYYLKWAGALVLAVIYVLLQWLTWQLMRLQANYLSSWCYPLSFIPSLLLLWMMGDESVLLSYAVALLMVMAAAWASQCWDRCRLSWPDLIVAPLLYVVAGPLAWLYVVLRVLRAPRHCWWIPVLMAVAHWASAYVLLQWPLKSVALGLNYYRIPLHYHVLQAILPLAGHSSVGGGRPDGPRPLHARCLAAHSDGGIGENLEWGVDIMRHHPGFHCHPCWLRQG